VADQGGTVALVESDTARGFPAYHRRAARVLRSLRLG
jgi:hypothetical protein